MVASKDQTCGAPGRFIGENVALLRDMVDYASFSNVPTAVFSLDPKRSLIEWIGHLCWLPCPRWASVHPFFTGFVCFIQVFRVVLMSMVIDFVPFLCPFSWCSQRLSSFSLVVCAGFGSQALLSPISHYADDISLSLTPMMPFWLRLTRTPDSRQHLDQS